MKFLADECTYFTTVQLLRSKGYDILTLNDVKMLQKPDNLVIEEALRSKRILLTRDKDFSNILIYPPKNYSGIIVLRMKAKDEK